MFTATQTETATWLVSSRSWVVCHSLNLRHAETSKLSDAGMEVWRKAVGNVVAKQGPSFTMGLKKKQALNFLCFWTNTCTQQVKTWAKELNNLHPSDIHCFLKKNRKKTNRDAQSSDILKIVAVPSDKLFGMVQHGAQSSSCAQQNIITS